MRTKNCKRNVLFLSLWLMMALAACTKNGAEPDVISVTPPEFHVVVVADDNNTQKVPEATVFVYKSEEDMNNETNVFLTKQTDSKGEAAFTKDEIKDKGVYFVKASKDAMAGSKASQYLLLNDGINYLFVKIQ